MAIWNQGLPSVSWCARTSMFLEKAPLPAMSSCPFVPQQRVVLRTVGLYSLYLYQAAQGAPAAGLTPRISERARRRAPHQQHRNRTEHHAHPRNSERPRGRVSQGHDLLGAIAPRRPASARERLGRPSGHFAHDTAPRPQGPREHRVHRDHPRLARRLQGERRGRPLRLLASLDARPLRPSSTTSSSSASPSRPSWPLWPQSGARTRTWQPCGRR